MQSLEHSHNNDSNQEKCCHSCSCSCHHEDESVNIRLIIGSAIIWAIAMFVPFEKIFVSFSSAAIKNIELCIFLLAYLIAGKDVIKEAVENIMHGKIFDENFLMSIASLGAFFIGDYAEAVAVMLFYQVGEAFQGYAVGKSRKSITELMDIRPDFANIRTVDGSIRKVDPQQVKLYDIIVVKPGEKVPLDGMVVKGTGSLDTSALTGESLPREVTEGDEVISGSININGLLEIEVKKEFAESTVSKILDMVENASEKKTRTERFITRFAKVYTPIVVASAVLMAVIPLFFGMNISDSMYRALTFLVVSCPCALVISVPLSFFAGIGAASKRGILIKGSNYIETLAKCDTIVFDKTGTLTKGIFKVINVKPVDNVSEQELLKMAACAEWFSNHPIAISLKNELEKRDRDSFEEIQKSSEDIKITDIVGKGICATIGDTEILAGNSSLMQMHGVACMNESTPGTVVYIALNRSFAGSILIADEEKDGVKDALEDIRKTGIKSIVMLTGDRKEIAQSVADNIGITEFYSGLLPDDKVKHVERMINDNKKLAFVGDGINDAPVLARADLGFAMGALGQDAAIEAADIVLMDDNPKGISRAIRIAKGTIAIANENIIFALIIKLAILILAGFGMANMWAAVFADVGVCVIAIVNALRALNIK
ncbi:MAG: heavy metal translocating P-type ATPase [Eubacterium sp.]